MELGYSFNLFSFVNMQTKKMKGCYLVNLNVILYLGIFELKSGTLIFNAIEINSVLNV
jgi:hypothetical protein